MDTHTNTNSRWTWISASNFEELKDLSSEELILHSFHDVDLILDPCHNSFSITIHDLEDDTYTGYYCDFELTSRHLIYFQHLRYSTYRNINNITII